MTARRSVAIIGAGLAGTSAALGFLDAGFDVTLYSDRDRESLRDKVPPTGVGVLFGKSREWDAEIIEDLYEVSNTTGISARLYSGSGDERAARNRMSQIVKAALNDEITKRTVREVISGERGRVMEAVRDKVVAEAKQIGVGIVDVRLKRVDYIDQINDSVYDRMRAERVRVANELRSTGAAESEKIRADADRQRTVILAEAFREAEKIKGEGDAKASAIYSDAFGKNPEFYKFYRSLEAYRASFKDQGDVMVIDANSEFFKYFKNPGR